MSRMKNEFLGWFCSIYVAVVVIHFSIGSYDEHPLLSSIVIFCLSIFTTFGILIIVRDIKLFGWKWILQTFKDFFK